MRFARDARRRWKYTRTEIGRAMADIVNIDPKPDSEFRLSPERETEIYESSRRTGRKIADAIFSGVNEIVDAKAADQAAEIAALRARVERLERLIAPRLTGALGE